MGLPSNFLTKAVDPLGLFRKGSRFSEARNKTFGFGRSDNPDAPTVAAIEEEEKKKRVMRSHLISTTDRGDVLTPDSYTGRDQILGG